MSRHFRALAVAAALLCMVPGTRTSAATATTSFAVSAVVLKACSVTALPLVFGNYDPSSGTVLDGTTTITVLCTVGTGFDIGLNAGNGTGATVAVRKMSLLGNALNYSLYQDPSRSTVWGNTVGTDVVSGTAGLAPTLLTVYGRVAAGQNVSVGTYTDIVQVTVTY